MTTTEQKLREALNRLAISLESKLKIHWSSFGKLVVCKRSGTDVTAYLRSKKRRLVTCAHCLRVMRAG